MRTRRSRMITIIALLVMFPVFANVGCNFGGASLPDQVGITLPDNSISQSQLGEGPVSLANTSWEFFRAADDRLLTRLRFNENGGVIELFDNAAVAAEILGSTIVADGKTHTTNTEGLTYSAGSYGAENTSGFSFELRAVASFTGIEVGTGTSFAFGSHDGQRMEGTFGFKTTLTSLAQSVLPAEANASDEFPFYALLIEE